MGFEEIIGQDLVIKALKRTLGSGQTAHAYLFSGRKDMVKAWHFFCPNLELQQEQDPPVKAAFLAEKPSAEIIRILSGSEGASLKVDNCAN